MEVDRLADLNQPRGAHQTLLLGDELTVIGGHTDGFKPLETLEYFRKGAWHSVPTAYTHDGSFVAVLPDGTAMIGGGSSEPFGIGQSWPVEVYDPANHNVRTLCILDRKRAYASALAMEDGRVVVAGNWYADDALALYDSRTGFSTVRELSDGLTRPWLLPISGDDILIVNSESNSGGDAEPVAERLSGGSSREPLLEKWRLVGCYRSSLEEYRIGGYSYLLSAFRRDDETWGMLQVTDGVFSEVQLEEPLPLTGIGGNAINWKSPLQVDRPRRQAWLKGIDKDGRLYFARIDYDATLDGGKASVELFYADCPDGRFSMETVLLTPSGIVLAGGKAMDTRNEWPEDDNFITSSAVWLFHPEPIGKAAFPWGWLLGGVLLAGGTIVLIVNRLRKKRAAAAEAADIPAEPESQSRMDLLEQISSLIEEKELWKRKDLRIGDIATELATNRNYVSILVNSIPGARFTTLVNGYRIRHAQQLLQEHPDMLLDDVAEESGFASRSSFFRNFKAQTGLTPMEWLRQNTPQ